MGYLFGKRNESRTYDCIPQDFIKENNLIKYSKRACSLAIFEGDIQLRHSNGQ